MAGWWFGTSILFSHISYIGNNHPINIGNLIIPIDEIIFFRGVNQPPTRWYSFMDFSPYWRSEHFFWYNLVSCCYGIFRYEFVLLDCFLISWLVHPAIVNWNHRNSRILVGLYQLTIVDIHVTVTGLYIPIVTCQYLHIKSNNGLSHLFTFVHTNSISHNILLNIDFNNHGFVVTNIITRVCHYPQDGDAVREPEIAL